MSWRELSRELSFGTRKKKNVVKRVTASEHREYYENCNRADLSAMLREMGLPESGSKEVKISRLIKANGGEEE